MKQLTLVFITLFLIETAYTQQGDWNYLNFECGGYVTEVIPVKYPSTAGISINDQVLYARTDIGGVYRSSNNGQSWAYVSTYLNYPTGGGQPGISGSELSIQGLAVRHNPSTNSQVLLAAWGNDSADARKVSYQSLWRSTDNGATWPVLKPIIQSPGVWFGGNNFPVKIGGPCIIYDPNNNPNGPYNMYMGGFPPKGQQCRLYKSTDEGSSWNWDLDNIRNFPGLINEGIICISITKKINPTDTAHIWVGTTHGIVYTANNGVSWQRIDLQTALGYTPYVKRIILKGTGAQTIALLTWGISDVQTGVGKCVKSGSNWVFHNRTTNFYTDHSGTRSGMFSALAFVDNAETMIIAGRYELPLRKTSNFGDSWFGEANPAGNDEVVFRYTQSGNNFPAHQQKGELDPNYGYMYDGLSCITKNPNSGWGNQWYLSGGAGARMTVSSAGADTNFANSRWKYTTFGQAMTVNYDVVFSKVNNREAIYLPLSDWTMGSTYQDRLSTPVAGGLIQDTLSYDRQETRPTHLYDTYISNVTRLLINPDNPNISYGVGGSVYDFNPTESYRAGFYVRTLSTTGSFTTERKTSHQFLIDNNRIIVDAIIYKTPGGTNRIIALVGANRSAVAPGDSLGVFYSDDGGDSWVKGSFNQPSGNQTMSTQQAFQSSMIPALIDGRIGDLFDGHFHLTHLGGNRVGLWLEAGGIFVSTNGGVSWASTSRPAQLTGYLHPGSLKYIGNDTIALAVRKGDTDPGGLFKGVVNSSGNITWTNSGNSIGGFTSATHLDVNLDRWVVYGKRSVQSSTDDYNQIYLSLDNGTTWTRLAPSSFPHLPSVKSLRIRAERNELWIATSRQGVWRYKDFDPRFTIKDVRANSGWNMVSVPLEIFDFRANSVYNNRIPSTSVFAYVNGNYIVKDTLANGIGYWVKYSSSQNINYAGLSKSFIVPVKTGWNMIGSVDQNLPKSKIYSIPDNLIISNFYGYENNYYNADTIKSGKGYWVKARSSGTITLDKNSTYSRTLYQCSDDSLPNPSGAPPIPLLVAPTNGSTGISNYPTLRWRRSDTTFLTYRLQISTNSCYTNLLYDESSISDTSKQVGLSYSTKYYWRINATNDVTTSSWSNTWNFTTRSAPQIDPCDPVVSSLSSLDKFTVRGADGNSQDMFIRNGGKGINLGISDFDMPPYPPKNLFNARFQSDKFIETIIPNGKIKKMPIVIKHAQYPVEISWDVKDANNIKYWTYKPGSNNEKILLTAKSKLTIPNTSNDILFVEAQAALPRPCEFYKTSTEENIPENFTLHQNYPNPFNPTTIIKYDLPENSYVRLKIYDVLGREVAKLVEEYQEAGFKYVEFKAANLTTGVYFYNLNAGNYTSIKKMLFIR